MEEEAKKYDAPAQLNEDAVWNDEELKYRININENLIPKGIYCDGCPFFKSLNFLGDIKIPYCLYLRQGSIPPDLNEDKIAFLEEHLGQSYDELSDTDTGIFGLDYLWDGCKECGINDEIDTTELI